MAILKGFPPSNTISTGCPNWKTKIDLPPQEHLEVLREWYYGPSPIKVKWKEKLPWTCPITGIVHYASKNKEMES